MSQNKQSCEAIKYPQLILSSVNIVYNQPITRIFQSYFYYLFTATPETVTMK